MSQDGTLAFYGISEPDDPRAVLAAALEACSPTGSFCLMRSPAPDRRWEEFRAELHCQTPGVVIYDHAADQIEILSESASSAETVAAWDANYLLLALDIPSVLPERVSRAVRADIPHEILGEFDPNRVSLLMGQHDLFECAEHDEGWLFAQPFLSIQFTGYGCPNDWHEARRRILEHPEVQAVRQTLESRLGPLDQCIFWSV